MQGPAVLEGIDIFPDPSHGIVNGRDDLIDTGHDDDVPCGKRPRAYPAPARVTAEDLAGLRDGAGARYKVVSRYRSPPELCPFRIVIFCRDNIVQVLPAGFFSRDQVLKSDLDERSRRSGHHFSSPGNQFLHRVQRPVTIFRAGHGNPVSLQCRDRPLYGIGRRDPVPFSGSTPASGIRFAALNCVILPIYLAGCRVAHVII